MKVINVEFKGDVVELVETSKEETLLVSATKESGIAEGAKLWVSVPKLCQNLGMSEDQEDYQKKKLKKDKTYQATLIKVPTQTRGLQESLCIPYEKLNGWLFSINHNRVGANIKDKLIEYKEECFDVLYKHFNKTTQPQHPTHHQIIGYKSQLSQKDKKIAQLEARIRQLQDPECIASTVVRALQDMEKYNKLKHQMKEITPLLN